MVPSVTLFKLYSFSQYINEILATEFGLSRQSYTEEVADFVDVEIAIR